MSESEKFSNFVTAAPDLPTPVQDTDYVAVVRDGITYRSPRSIGFSDVGVVLTGTSYSVTFPGVFYVNQSGNFTFSLPAPTLPSLERNFFIWVKDMNGQGNTRPITIAASAGILIDGVATNVIDSNYGARILSWNGTGWSVFGALI